MASPSISIHKHYVTTTHTAYEVMCFNYRVRTIVTRSPAIVTSWIAYIRSSNNLSCTKTETDIQTGTETWTKNDNFLKFKNRFVRCDAPEYPNWDVSRTENNNSLKFSCIIGLDTEWLNPVATLQLCVGPNCLIYHLLHTSAVVPTALRDFLGDPRWRFAGVGIAGDLKRLAEDYGLAVATAVDVSRVAAEEGKTRVNAGLKEVAKAVLGWEVEKPKEVTLSRWDKEVLDDNQVQYACVDAFLSYMIAKELCDHSIGDDMVDHNVFEELGHFAS